MADRLEPLRTRITVAIQHGTDLIADLQSVADRFEVLIPSLSELTRAERWAEIARLCAIDENVCERLEALVENLADILGGLTTTDGGQAWLEHQRSRLATGEDSEAA
jgi:hypothetical protein